MGDDKPAGTLAPPTITLSVRGPSGRLGRITTNEVRPELATQLPALSELPTLSSGWLYSLFPAAWTLDHIEQRSVCRFADPNHADKDGKERVRIWEAFIQPANRESMGIVKLARHPDDGLGLGAGQIGHDLTEVLVVAAPELIFYDHPRAVVPVPRDDVGGEGLDRGFDLDERKGNANNRRKPIKVF